MIDRKEDEMKTLYLLTKPTGSHELFILSLSMLRSVRMWTRFNFWHVIFDFCQTSDVWCYSLMLLTQAVLDVMSCHVMSTCLLWHDKIQWPVCGPVLCWAQHFNRLTDFVSSLSLCLSLSPSVPFCLQISTVTKTTDKNDNNLGERATGTVLQTSRSYLSGS